MKFAFFTLPVVQQTQIFSPYVQLPTPEK